MDHNVQPYITGLLSIGFLVIHSLVTFTKYAKNTKSDRLLIFASLGFTCVKPLLTKILFSLWAFLFLHTFANKCLSCHKSISMFGLLCPWINVKFPGWFEIFCHVSHQIPGMKKNWMLVPQATGRMRKKTFISVFQKGKPITFVIYCRWNLVSYPQCEENMVSDNRHCFGINSCPNPLPAISSL